MVGRVRLFNAYVASLLHFKLQFVEADKSALTAYWHAAQMVTKAPWQTMPAKLLQELRTVGLPAEIRDPHVMAVSARASFLSRSQVWARVDQSVMENEGSDAASLNPGRPWHSSTVVGCLRRHRAEVELRAPQELEIPLKGVASKVYVLMRGSAEDSGGGGQLRCSDGAARDGQRTQRERCEGSWNWASRQSRTR